MSNIFKFYINNNNTFNDVYLFINPKYSATNSSIPSIDELNANFNNYNSFIYSEIYEKHFANDFNNNASYCTGNNPIIIKLLDLNVTF